MLEMAGGAALILVIPGPTNTLLFVSGLRVRLRTTLPLVAAEAFGYITAISLFGFLLVSAFGRFAWLHAVIKGGCAVYVGYLALKMWSQSHLTKERVDRIVSTRDMLVATLTNPKGLLFASTIFPAESFRTVKHFSVAMICFLAILVPIGIGWASLGSACNQSDSLIEQTPRLLRVASFVLVFLSGSLVYSVVKAYTLNLV
ncbi:LysE family translocator [Burkholderia sp. Bp9140]|nr:LysE family translocator [Burkholderia sp. Bp9140]